MIERGVWRGALEGGKVKNAILQAPGRGGFAFAPEPGENLRIPMTSRVHPNRRARGPGFTLVEIMVAVVLIGVLAMLAVPALQRTQRASRNARMVNDFRVFAQAFEIYNTQNGGWPDTAAPGVVPTLPTSIADTLRSASWQSATTLGGQWQWENETGSAGDAGICVIGFNCTDEQLRDLDTKLDDGNLGTGRFQKTSATRVIYVLAAAP